MICAFPLILFLLFAVPSGLRAEQADSASVFRYPECREEFSPDYGDNSRQLRWLDERMQAFRLGRDTLRLDIFMGNCPDISVVYRRSRRLSKLLKERYGLNEQDILHSKHFYPHPLRGDVAVAGVSKYVEHQVCALPDEAKEAARREAAVRAFADSIRYVPAEEPLGLVSVVTPLAKDKARAVPVYLKSNLAGWGIALANLGVEVGLSRRVSISLPCYYSGWDVGKEHALRTFLLQPEARYWLAAVGKGHFFGLHAHAGAFNLKWGRDRYQNTGRPLLGAGVSYGYALRFGRHWGAEFTLGAGYANMKYDTYYNIDRGARIDTRNKNYWGITQAGISVSYGF